MENEYFIIPMKNLFNHFGQDHTIEIYTKEKLSLDSFARETFIIQLEDYLHSPVMMKENTGAEDVIDAIDQGKIFSIILFTLAIINIFYIYGYILEKRRKRIHIYRLNGATIGFMIRSLVIGLFMIYTICFGISYVLLLAFQKILSYSVLENQSFRLPLGELVSLFVILLMVYLLPLFIYIRNWLKNSLIFSLRGGR